MSQQFGRRTGPLANNATSAANHEFSNRVGRTNRPPERVEPAEARTFSIVEMLVLIVGFSLAAGLMARAEQWNTATLSFMTFGLLAYAAIGLGVCGPILVSWRERLGRRRPVWGLGESLWFATGLLVQIVAITYFLFSLLDRLVNTDGLRVVGVFVPLALMVLLPTLYLTGNPRIELRRAPGSWSNVVGLTSVALWGLTAWAATTM